MSDWLHDLPLSSMALVVFGFTYAGDPGSAERLARELIITLCHSLPRSAFAS